MSIWYFPRLQLAEKYLKILEVGISANLAIIAPRRKGKTLFVLNDVAALAKKNNYLPVYASLWQNINAPHEGLIFALKEAISALDNKLSSRLLKTKIKSTTLGNDLIGKVELEFADEPQKPTNNDLILIDQLISQLQQKAKNKTLLLLIDEVQHLATSSHFDSLTHALRTSLDKRRGQVKTIFTGSSRHYMSLLFNESQSPFYHFVETVPFPELGHEFLQFIAERLRDRHGLSISENRLAKIFAAVDQSPYWMMKILSRMLVFDQSLNDAMNYVLQMIEAVENFSGIEKKLKPIDKIVFLSLSSGASPFSKAVLAKVERETAVKGIASNVQRSLQRLVDLQLISQIEKGKYIVEKPSLKEYLIK